MSLSIFKRSDLEPARPFKRSIGWIGTTALAMGGSNQSLFLIAALFVGQGDIPGQGSAAIPLLIIGLLLSYAALPGWIELVMMSPAKVGGIAAACTEAFKPYGKILSTLTGMCYWWGWVPTCGLTAILSATAITQWFLPQVPIPVVACALVCFFTVINLLGITWVTRLAVPVAACSAVLAFISALAPVLTGAVDWHRAVDFHLTTPFAGWFGGVTSLMAGLYLIGFAAPAFEAAACHVAETKNPEKNVPRAMKASALMASVYFVILPLVWFGALGSKPLGEDLGLVLGPTFAPVFGAFAKSAAIGFMMLNMFHGTIQPLAGASRTLSQLAEDGLAPRILAWRSSADVPVVATLVTAAFAIVFLLIGDPIWLVAAANFTYLIGIAAPSIAVWLLRKNAPHAPRLYRAPKFTVGLGVFAALVWAAATVLGFQQFGLPTVVFGLAMAYSGAAIYAWRKWEDRRQAGLPGFAPSLHVRLTGAMLLVLALDGAGYILAVSQLPKDQLLLSTALEDIFVAVAMLTITVGIVLPGLIATSAQEVSDAAKKLSSGTLRDFSRAMNALGRGDLDAAQAVIDIRKVEVRSHDELGEMAVSFNAMQAEVASAANGLDDAREGLRSARQRLTSANYSLEQKVLEQQRLAEELLAAKSLAEIANAAKNQFMARMSHELRTPLNGVLGPADLLLGLNPSGEQHEMLLSIRDSCAALRSVVEQILDISLLESNALTLRQEDFCVLDLIQVTGEIYRREADAKGLSFEMEVGPFERQEIKSDAVRVRQILDNLLSNALKFTKRGGVTLRASLALSQSDQGVLHLSVTDTGPGIASEHHANIFASFAQADETRTRAHDGAGVGLFLVRELVKRLGGRVDVDSVVGEGATFTVTLPVVLVDRQFVESSASQSAPTPRETKPTALLAVAKEFSIAPLAESAPKRGREHAEEMQPSAQRPRILVAEDNPTNQTVALASLRRMGLDAALARDGVEALQMFQEGRFDLILMDCHMPRMDGIAATAAIRTIEHARTDRPVPIIAVTADMTSENTQQCRAAGITDIMSKPFSFSEFAETLNRYLKGEAAERALQPAVQSPSVPEKAANAVIDLDAGFDHACIDNLRALVDEDSPDFVLEVIGTYRESAALQVSELHAAISDRVPERVSQIAHSLKSSSAYVGAVGFARLMKELELAAKNSAKEELFAFRPRIDAAFSSASGFLVEVIAKGGVHG